MRSSSVMVVLAGVALAAFLSACDGVPTPIETPWLTETAPATVAPSPTGTGGPIDTQLPTSSPFPTTLTGTPTPLLTRTPAGTGTPTPLLTKTPAGTGTPRNGLVCASYFRTFTSDRMIQGSWSDDPAVTASILACFEYMDREILHDPGCSQPGDALALTVVLIPEARHNYDMPLDINMTTEFVTSAFCPRTTATPSSGEGSLICASYFLQPGTDDYIQGSWTDGSDDPTATTSQAGCMAYMEENILNRPQCAQPYPVDHVILALLTEWRHTFYLPSDLDPDREFVGIGDCPTVTRTPPP